MDYAHYRAEREALLARSSPLRLDCMNPAAALAAWRSARTPAQGTESEALGAWNRATGLGFAPDEVLFGRGIRALLAGLLPHLCTGRELWLPEDVYPEYWRCAHGLAAQAYATLPEPDWSFLATSSPRSVALVTAPLAPRGRALARAEVVALAEWLAASPERRLVLDGAYTYDFAAARTTLATLLAEPRTVFLGSLAKPWLRPATLGLARVSPSLLAGGPALDFEAPDFASARAALENDADLPARQAQAFAREWARLAARLRTVEASWRPPDNGYFSLLRIPFRELLERHGVLAVPASVFGSRDARLSVVTCLFELDSPSAARACPTTNIPAPR